MYEETKIKFDWKGFLLKFAIIILVVILVNSSNYEIVICIKRDKL